MKQRIIRWDEVRKRLRASEEALSNSLWENPERIKTIFRQRAAALASEHAGTKPAEKRTPALIVRLGQERYAVALSELSEVLAFRGCARVPGTSPEFLGVINLRGELRPVIDLAQVLSKTVSIDSGAVLVLRRRAVLKVDAAEDLRDVAPDELACPIQRPLMPRHYMQGFASGTLGVLDVESILSTVFPSKGSRSI